MRKTNLDRGWLLRAQNPLTLWFDREEPVDLPHDYSIGLRMTPDTAATGSNAYLPGGIVEYQKKLTFPEGHGRVLVEFEGVYHNAVVRLDGETVGKHPYGYTGFHCDLTAAIKPGVEQTLSVLVNNTDLPNSRWYSGTGIYRSAWLLEGRGAWIEPWGVFARPALDGADAVFSVDAHLCVEADDGYELTFALRGADGNEAARASAALPRGAGERVIAQNLRIRDARLWSPDDPYLYTLRVMLSRGGEEVDALEVPVGARSVAVSRESGFLLNGRAMKLKGGCVHHDCGPLGAAAYGDAERRKVRLLRESGFNAVRCAHNPPSPAFLDACDEQGMLVIDEIFDTWGDAKMTYDYNLFFDDWWERDLRSMLLRDRNHPCVIMWSTGNEIVERDGRSGGYALARKLAAFVREYDATRPVTNALCGTSDMQGWADATAPFAEPLDVVGYNYLLDRYEEDGRRFPNRVLCGTETFPKDAFDYWEATERLGHVIGDFVWTSMDYLGEAGIGRPKRGENDKFFCAPYPYSHAYCGDIDLCGGKRPQSHYRDCVWGISRAPYIAVYDPRTVNDPAEGMAWCWPDVQPCWTWTGHEGSKTKVDVYCADDEVELFRDGVSLGRRAAGKAQKYIASFPIEYRPGELVAVGYRDGREVGRAALRTASKAVRLALSPETAALEARFGALAYVPVAALDEGGSVADGGNDPVYVTVSGPGRLIAMCSADPRSDEPYAANARRLYYGRALAVVRADGAPGDILVTAAAEGLAPASVSIPVR